MEDENQEFQPYDHIPLDGWKENIRMFDARKLAKQALEEVALQDLAYYGVSNLWIMAVKEAEPNASHILMLRIMVFEDQANVDSLIDLDAFKTICLWTATPFFDQGRDVVLHSLAILSEMVVACSDHAATMVDTLRALSPLVEYLELTGPNGADGPSLLEHVAMVLAKISETGHGAHAMVVSGWVSKIMPFVRDLQKWGERASVQVLSVIENFTRNDSALSELAQLDIYTPILSILTVEAQEQWYNDVILSLGCGIIAECALLDRARDFLIDADAVGVMKQVILASPDNLTVVALALLVFKRLAEMEEPDVVFQFTAQEAVETVIDALEYHQPVTSIQINGIMTLNALLPKLMRQVVTRGGHLLVYNAMMLHAYNDSLYAAVVTFLNYLVTDLSSLDLIGILDVLLQKLEGWLLDPTTDPTPANMHMLKYHEELVTVVTGQPTSFQEARLESLPQGWVPRHQPEIALVYPEIEFPEETDYVLPKGSHRSHRSHHAADYVSNFTAQSAHNQIAKKAEEIESLKSEVVVGRMHGLEREFFARENAYLSEMKNTRAVIEQEAAKFPSAFPTKPKHDVVVVNDSEMVDVPQTRPKEHDPNAFDDSRPLRHARYKLEDPYLRKQADKHETQKLLREQRVEREQEKERQARLEYLESQVTEKSREQRDREEKEEETERVAQARKKRKEEALASSPGQSPLKRDPYTTPSRDPRTPQTPQSPPKTPGTQLEVATERPFYELWSIDLVIGWLHRNDLGRYEPHFRANHIGGDVLMDITDQILKDNLGISMWGDRRRILSAIGALKREFEERGNMSSRNHLLGTPSTIRFDQTSPMNTTMNTTTTRTPYKVTSITRLFDDFPMKGGRVIPTSQKVSKAQVEARHGFVKQLQKKNQKLDSTLRSQDQTRPQAFRVDRKEMEKVAAEVDEEQRKKYRHEQQQHQMGRSLGLMTERDAIARAAWHKAKQASAEVAGEEANIAYNLARTWDVPKDLSGPTKDLDIYITKKTDPSLVGSRPLTPADELMQKYSTEDSGSVAVHLSFKKDRSDTPIRAMTPNSQARILISSTTQTVVESGTQIDDKFAPLPITNPWHAAIAIQKTYRSHLARRKVKQLRKHREFIQQLTDMLWQVENDEALMRCQVEDSENIESKTLTAAIQVSLRAINETYAAFANLQLNLEMKLNDQLSEQLRNHQHSYQKRYMAMATNSSGLSVVGSNATGGPTSVETYRLLEHKSKEVLAPKVDEEYNQLLNEQAKAVEQIAKMEQPRYPSPTNSHRSSPTKGVPGLELTSSSHSLKQAATGSGTPKKEVPGLEPTSSTHNLTQAATGSGPSPSKSPPKASSPASSSKPTSQPARYSPTRARIGAHRFHPAFDTKKHASYVILPDMAIEDSYTPVRDYPILPNNKGYHHHEASAAGSIYKRRVANTDSSHAEESRAKEFEEEKREIIFRIYEMEKEHRRQIKNQEWWMRRWWGQTQKRFEDEGYALINGERDQRNGVRAEEEQEWTEIQVQLRMVYQRVKEVMLSIQNQDVVNRKRKEEQEVEEMKERLKMENAFRRQAHKNRHQMVADWLNMKIFDLEEDHERHFMDLKFQEDKERRSIKMDLDVELRQLAVTEHYRNVQEALAIAKTVTAEVADPHPAAPQGMIAVARQNERKASTMSTKSAIVAPMAEAAPLPHDGPAEGKQEEVVDTPSNDEPLALEPSAAAAAAEDGSAQNGLWKDPWSASEPSSPADAVESTETPEVGPLPPIRGRVEVAARTDATAWGLMLKDLNAAQLASLACDRIMDCCLRSATNPPPFLLRPSDVINTPRIKLANCGLTDFHLAPLLYLLQSSRALTAIDIDSNVLTDQTAFMLADMMMACETLSTISLCWNGITNAGANRLYEALEECPGIVALDLEGNHVTPSIHKKIHLKTVSHAKNSNLSVSSVDAMSRSLPLFAATDVQPVTLNHRMHDISPAIRSLSATQPLPSRFDGYGPVAVKHRQKIPAASTSVPF